jgi:hypothetical protein
MNLTASLILIVLILLGALAVVTWGVNIRRAYLGRQRAKTRAELLPRFLAAIDGADVPRNEFTRREYETFIDLACGMLPTLRGEESETLIRVLDEWGIIESALLDLHHRSPYRRAGAAEVLGIARVQRAVPELVRLLQDRDPDVRRTAARSLGLIGDAAAVAPLLRTIGAPRSVPLNTTTMALLRMDVDALEPLLKGLRSAPDPGRSVCAELLGLRGSIAALPALTHALEFDDVLEVRIRAARALGRIGAASSVDVLAATMSQNEPAALRAVVVRALGEIGGRRTVALLNRALDAPEHIVQSNAARALAAAGDDGVEALTRASHEPTGLRGAYAREALSYVALEEHAKGAA